MVPRIVAFRHEPNEPLGYFETILNEQKIPFEYIDLYDSNEIPRLTHATHLIFLGGNMSVNDEEEFPWLIQEKDLIRRSQKTGQKVLGICLGAQLISSAYGAKVFRYVNETGWHNIHRKDDATGIFAQFPDQFPVFQIHNDSFEIPYGGRLLAYGAKVKNQAFSCRNALGLQFHLEMTGEIIRDWSKSLHAFPQLKIARETPRFIDESNRLCRLVAEDFIR
ncbi:MAG: type 1 glutamine amidotransferase [Methanoregula sp.]|nr:type 1 glutamine amidotransferase [Methanoregula sp.]